MKHELKTTIEVEIRESSQKGYNYEYHFHGKHRERVEFNPKRYVRLLSVLRNVRLEV